VFLSWKMSSGLSRGGDFDDFPFRAGDNADRVFDCAPIRGLRNTPEEQQELPAWPVLDLRPAAGHRREAVVYLIAYRTEYLLVHLLSQVAAGRSAGAAAHKCGQIQVSRIGC
jgi:hypothetical protein